MKYYKISGVSYTLKKSLSIVELRSFQNASIEIKHIPFVYQQNLFPVTKLICEMQKENIFSNERFHRLVLICSQIFCQYGANYEEYIYL